MKIFVTGGAGFIGSHLCEKLLKEGHEVLAFDNLVLGKREHLEPLKKFSLFKFVQADLLDLQEVILQSRGMDLVVHLAANSDISQGAARTDVDMQNGTIATYNLLESMRVNKLDQLIFASTSAVYGEALVKPTPETYGPLEPISFYGASKLACEAMISAFSHNCGIKAWVYRFANVVGSHATHGAIFDFVSRLNANPRELSVLGDGSQRKSYLHVSDCIDGIWYGYKNSSQSFQCFNLASEGVTQVKFIAEEVVEQFKFKTGIADVTLKFGLGDRGWVGDVPYTHLDGSKLQRSGWKPAYASDEALKKAVSEVILENAFVADQKHSEKQA